MDKKNTRRISNSPILGYGEYGLQKFRESTIEPPDYKRALTRENR